MKPVSPKPRRRMRQGGRRRTWCVYALTAARATLPRVRGAGDTPLQAVTAGAVTAIVGEQQRPPKPSRGALIRYDATVRALTAHFPAILPARFGTCFDEPDELRYVLRARERALRASLAHVRHRVQMTVRIIASPGPPPVTRQAGGGTRPTLNETFRVGRVPRSASGATDRGPGAAYLRSRAVAAAREREIAGFDPVRTAVRRWVRDERVEKQKGVASVYHLVPRGSVDVYRRAIERASAAAGLQIVVSGPFPPYAFANL